MVGETPGDTFVGRGEGACGGGVEVRAWARNTWAASLTSIHDVFLRARTPAAMAVRWYYVLLARGEACGSYE